MIQWQVVTLCSRHLPFNLPLSPNTPSFPSPAFLTLSHPWSPWATLPYEFPPLPVHRSSHHELQREKERRTLSSKKKVENAFSFSPSSPSRPFLLLPPFKKERYSSPSPSLFWLFLLVFSLFLLLLIFWVSFCNPRPLPFLLRPASQTKRILDSNLWNLIHRLKPEVRKRETKE